MIKTSFCDWQSAEVSRSAIKSKTKIAPIMLVTTMHTSRSGRWQRGALPV
jgi:hypothetical protein